MTSNGIDFSFSFFHTQYLELPEAESARWRHSWLMLAAANGTGLWKTFLEIFSTYFCSTGC